MTIFARNGGFQFKIDDASSTNNPRNPQIIPKNGDYLSEIRENRDYFVRNLSDVSGFD